MSSVTLLCPACDGRVSSTLDDSDTSCPGCSAQVELRGRDNPDASQPLTLCVVCGSEAMFIQKDFNRKLGVALVAAGSLVVFWNFLVGLGVLVALAIADYFLYGLLPDVTVCYACKSVYRGVKRNPDHRAYELSVDETFEGSGQTPSFRKARDSDRRGAADATAEGRSGDP